jgi:hypothetical protein
MQRGGALEITDVVGVAEIRSAVNSIRFALKNDLPTHFDHHFSLMFPHLTHSGDTKIESPLRPCNMLSVSSFSSV